jgi:hypothetical protein
MYVCGIFNGSRALRVLQLPSASDLKSPSVYTIKPLRVWKVYVPQRRGLMRTSITSDCYQTDKSADHSIDWAPILLNTTSIKASRSSTRGRFVREVIKIEIHITGTGRTDSLWAQYGSRSFAPWGKERETSYFLSNRIPIPIPLKEKKKAQFLTYHSPTSEALKGMLLPNLRVKFPSRGNLWEPSQVTTLLHSNNSTIPPENNTTVRYSTLHLWHRIGCWLSQKIRFLTGFSLALIR